MTAVLSRVAERAYWLGRYLERADATARLITVNGNLLMDLPARLPLGWQPLIDITGAGELFEELYGPNAPAAERQVCRFMTTDTRNPGAIVNSLAGLRANARNIRETMPQITFEYINDLHLFARSALGTTPSRSRRALALEGISRRIQQLEGFLSQNMLHDAHWDLLRLGNHIERADMTTRIIDVRSANLFVDGFDLAPFEDIQWRSILRSSFAMQSYNISVRGPVTSSRALDFLFRNERLPRSYMRCLEGVRRSLRELPRHEEPMAACEAAVAAIVATDVGRLGEAAKSAELSAFIDRCQVQLANLHQAVVGTYFEHASGA